MQVPAKYVVSKAAQRLGKLTENYQIITAAGFGEFFTHRLGHGLGLEMHEHPFLNGANAEKLKAGQVVTNEPVSLLMATWDIMN